MVDTVKIRQLRPAPLPAPRKGAHAAAPEAVVPGRLDRVVADVKLALLTTGLTIEKDRDRNRGQDPYNSRPVARGRDTWSDRNRRR
ncbi:MAG: hypothetical protein U1F30_08675 [Steroidobacteraceae bacterium]